MNKSMTSMMMAGAVVVAALALLGVSQANASLTIDAKIWDGAQYVSELNVTGLAPGTIREVHVFATVNGNPGDGDWTDEGLLQAMFSLVSRQGGGGAAIAGSELRWFLTTPISSIQNPFRSTGAYSGLGRTSTGGGAINDLNADGISDIGSLDLAANANTAFLNAGTMQMGGPDDDIGTTEFNIPAPDGVSWMPVAKYKFLIAGTNLAADVGNGSFFDVVLPPWGAGDIKAAIWNENGLSLNGIGHAGSSVRFFVDPIPEPATMAFLAIGGIGMIGGGLARRRARKA